MKATQAGAEVVFAGRIRGIGGFGVGAGFLDFEFEFFFAEFAFVFLDLGVALADGGVFVTANNGVEAVDGVEVLGVAVAGEDEGEVEGLFFEEVEGGGGEAGVAGGGVTAEFGGGFLGLGGVVAAVEGESALEVALECGFGDVAAEFFAAEIDHFAEGNGVGVPGVELGELGAGEAFEAGEGAGGVLSF